MFTFVLVFTFTPMTKDEFEGEVWTAFSFLKVCRRKTLTKQTNKSALPNMVSFLFPSIQTHFHHQSWKRHPCPFSLKLWRLPKIEGSILKYTHNTWGPLVHNQSHTRLMMVAWVMFWLWLVLALEENLLYWFQLFIYLLITKTIDTSSSCGSSFK